MTTYSTSFSVSSFKDHYFGANDSVGKAPKGLLRVFVEDGTRPGMSDICADFSWRRSVDYSDLANDDRFRHFIYSYMLKNNLISPSTDIAELKFKHSGNCGCQGCPCSPGIIVQRSGWNTKTCPSIYVSVENSIVGETKLEYVL